VLPLSSTVPIEHRSFDNFRVVLHSMNEKMEVPRRVVAAGSRAGGYGATTNFP
jgi:predicted transposase YdaD